MSIPIRRVRAKGQITLPGEVREAAHVEEGDVVEFEVTPDGILLRPKKLIDTAQAWFWTESWQRGEAAASADIAAGRIARSNSTEEFLAALDE